jgi:hypothetical protein
MSPEIDRAEQPHSKEYRRDQADHAYNGYGDDPRLCRVPGYGEWA